MRLKQVYVGGVFVVLSALAWACGSGAPAPQNAVDRSSAGAWSGSVTYALTPSGAKLYPNASWLPAPYQPKYPKVGDTIKLFTEQSLQRDGIAYTSVTASDDGLVTITGTDARAAQYAESHPAFIDTAHAMQGWNGINLCQQTTGCWDPSTRPGQPWAFFLPLGMPLVNQQSVSLLDYPPATSLIAGDYLRNFTMDRWSRVLSAVGIANPILYETIVDTRPIAAPGSGQSHFLPDPTQYFNTPPDRFYVTPMLTLLTDPPSNLSTTNTVPVQVLGGPAQVAWAAIVGSPVKPLSVGSTTLPGATKATSWVAGNHPDVTTYQCCSGDKNSKCQDRSTNSWSYSLIADEQIDLQVACIVKSLAENQSLLPANAANSCNVLWGGDPAKLPAANARTLCVQAKLDNQSVKCASVADAENYCAAHDNNACFDLTCPSTAAKPFASQSPATTPKR